MTLINSMACHDDSGGGGAGGGFFFMRAPKYADATTT
jgi:hypothetical protein